MSFDAELNRKTDKAGDRVGLDSSHRLEGSLDPDPALQAALRDFRLSVHAWSQAVYTRPRPALQPVRWKLWRPAGAWTLGLMMAAGIAGGGYLELQHHQELARIAAAQQAAHQRQLAEERAREAEEELARVDSEIARQVPNAMEPLAQLMTEDEKQ
jgi:hypothetical protein